MDTLEHWQHKKKKTCEVDLDLLSCPSSRSYHRSPEITTDKHELLSSERTDASSQTPKVLLQYLVQQVDAMEYTTGPPTTAKILVHFPMTSVLNIHSLIAAHNRTSPALTTDKRSWLSSERSGLDLHLQSDRLH
jgi:hypothetical protein